MNITLISTEQNPQYPILGNPTSEITVLHVYNYRLVTASKDLWYLVNPRTWAVVSRAQRGHYYMPEGLLNTIDPVGRSH